MNPQTSESGSPSVLTRQKADSGADPDTDSDIHRPKKVDALFMCVGAAKRHGLLLRK
jgi:hypothetical protein